MPKTTETSVTLFPPSGETIKYFNVNRIFTSFRMPGDPPLTFDGDRMGAIGVRVRVDVSSIPYIIESVVDESSDDQESDQNHAEETGS